MEDARAIKKKLAESRRNEMMNDDDDKESKHCNQPMPLKVYNTRFQARQRKETNELCAIKNC